MYKKFECYNMTDYVIGRLAYRAETSLSTWDIQSPKACR
jgi:hypothetical protein